MLSPSFFKAPTNVVCVTLKLNYFGCHVNKCYVGCLFYDNDNIIISASRSNL